MKQNYTYCPPPVEVKGNYLTTNPIDINRIVSASHSKSAGALVLFSGDVRDLNNGKQVSHLFYESYEPMANKMISKIIHETQLRWKLVDIQVIHRLGKLEIGETAVIILTTSVHRDEAYAANRYLIDRVKHEVPIWKNEFYSDGTSEWGNNCNCGTKNLHLTND